MSVTYDDWRAAHGEDAERIARALFAQERAAHPWHAGLRLLEHVPADAPAWILVSLHRPWSRGFDWALGFHLHEPRPPAFDALRDPRGRLTAWHLCLVVLTLHYRRPRRSWTPCPFHFARIRRP